MFSKRDFPTSLSFPKDTPMWCGLSFQNINGEDLLLFRVILQNGASFSKMIEKESGALFDFSTSEATNEVFVKGDAFFKALSGTNLYKGFDLELDEDEVRIITNKKTAIKVVKPPFTVLGPNGNEVFAGRITAPSDLESLPSIYAVHKPAQDERLSAFLSNIHVTHNTNSVDFWATYGGMWHMIHIPVTEISESTIKTSKPSYAVSPFLLKNIGCFKEPLTKVSIIKHSEKEYLIVFTNDDGKIQVFFPMSLDICQIHYPEIPDYVQSKQQPARYIHISEKDRKVILKNVAVKNYYVLPEIWQHLNKTKKPLAIS